MHAPIAIAGGGMGGLVLARTLAQYGVSSTVFERESGPGVRGQGGSLDLHPDSGQLAMRVAGLENDFWAMARRGGEELRVYDRAGRKIGHRMPDSSTDRPARPEVDRPALRDLLRDSLPDGTIRWGHRLTIVKPRELGGFELTFDGVDDVITCDLLVGADGSRSIVRPWLTDAQASYVYAYVEMHITDVDSRAPAISELVGQGSLWAFGRGMYAGAQRNGDGGMRVSLSVAEDENWMAAHGIREHDAAAARSGLREALADWSPTITQLFEATDDDYVVPRSITTLPQDIGWQHQSDVTLLGDAAHLAPPAGEGANQALLDGVNLAQALVAQGVSPDGSLAAPQRRAAIEHYENEMFPRASEAVKHSLEAIRVGLAPDAAENAAKMFS